MAAGEKKWEAAQKAKKNTQAKKPEPPKKPAYLTQKTGPDFARDARTKLAEQSAYNRAMTEMKTPTKSSGGSGGGAGGPTALDRYVQSLQKMLNTGDYRQPQDDLMSKLTEMYGGAQTQVGSAMDNLTSFLQGQQNPYQGFQAQAAQVTPQLTEFLQSQGASTDPLAQLAAVRQQEATNQATAFQNLGNTLSQIYGANQQGMVADVGQQRANMLAALEGARAGYGTQLEQSAFENRNKLLQMLLEGLAKGGRPGRGSLTGGDSSGPAFLPRGIA